MSRDLSTVSGVRSPILWLYSLLMLVVWAMLRACGFFVPGMNRRLRARVWSRETLKEVRRIRQAHQKSVLFYCSSAGEFEQAKPLIKKYEADDSSWAVFIIFFSESGLRFARARDEARFVHLCPPDTIWHWRKILDEIAPDLTFVVRYALWPAFLVEAKKRGQLLLIDGVLSPGVLKSSLRRWITGGLFRLFDGLFVARHKDREFFQSLGVAADRAVVVGDTKFDRVVERADQRRKSISSWKHWFDHRYGPQKRAVVGSGWPEDIKLVLGAFRQGMKDHTLHGWQVILAPHDLSPKMLSWVEREVSSYGFAWARMSTLLDEVGQDCRDVPVVILDRLGLLSDIYGIAHLAFVGGGLHHRVHNVLEPAVFGLQLFFGPRFETSMEASHLVERGLASVVSEESSMLALWSLVSQQSNQMNQRLADEVVALSGAADRIKKHMNMALSDG